jgi:hypothetical protein
MERAKGEIMKTFTIAAVILMSVGALAQQPDSHAAQAPQAASQTAPQASPQKCLAVYPVAGNKKGAALLGAASFGVGLIGMHGEYFVYVGSAGLSIADTKPKYNRKDLVKLENSGVRIVVSPNKVANQSADVHVTVGSDDVNNPCR